MPSCKMMDLFRRLLCFLDFHDFRIVEVTMGFWLFRNCGEGGVPPLWSSHRAPAA